MEELYQEMLLEHYRHPRHKGECPGCALSARQDNPLCGDEITLHLDLQADTIARARFEGQGCAISQASASMMAESITGQPVARARALSEGVRAMLRGAPPAGDLGVLQALAGVARFPARVKCALLPWNALDGLLGEAVGGGAPER